MVLIPVSDEICKDSMDSGNGLQDGLGGTASSLGFLHWARSLLIALLPVLHRFMCSKGQAGLCVLGR